MPSDEEIVRRIQTPGKYHAVAHSLDDARRLLREAMPDAIELPQAVVGVPYPRPALGCKKWYQIHPAEPIVGHYQPHFKYEDWTGGKKGHGGKWGHIEF